MMLPDVRRLSVAYIGPKSRIKMPRKTKIGTEVAHVTRDSDTTFKVKSSRSPGRFTHRGDNASGSCSGERGNVLAVGTYCYVAIHRIGDARRFGSHTGRRGAGAYRVGRPPTDCFFWITNRHCWVTRAVCAELHASLPIRISIWQ